MLACHFGRTPPESTPLSEPTQKAEEGTEVSAPEAPASRPVRDSALTRRLLLRLGLLAGAMLVAAAALLLLGRHTTNTIAGGALRPQAATPVTIAVAPSGSAAPDGVSGTAMPNESPTAEVLELTATETPSTRKPPRPLSVRIEPTDDGAFRVLWEPVSAPILGYHVYYSVTSGSRYFKVNETPIKTTSSRLRGFAKGQTYFVVVTSVSSTGMESDNSDEQAVTP